MAAATAVTSPSRDTLERVRRFYGLPFADAEVIPNPGPEVAAQDCWSLASCERLALLFVGRFDRLKGGDVVVDAFREIATEFAAARLIFVGPEPGLSDGSGRTVDLATYLASSVPEAEIRARIEVAGPLPPDAIAELRKRAFITVVPSRYETFSMTVVEALAQGCPVVAADAGGMPEVLRDGENGRLFHAGNARDLAARLREMFADPVAAEAMGRRARVDYLERFAPAVVARRMAEFYRKVVGGRHPTR